MLGKRDVLASPRRVSPEALALATVALLTAAATPPVAASIPDAATEIGGSQAAMGVVVVTTALLAAGLARIALDARSQARARLWLAFGAAAAGMLATLLAGAGVSLLQGRLETLASPRALLMGSVLGGGSLGVVFGTAFGPTVATAFRARLAPTHDGVDRVAVAGGATLLAFGLVRHLMPASLPGALLGDVAAAAGVLALAVASARILLRVRLLARAREGSEPGFHVVPRSGKEDEAALLPLVRAGEPGGVLTVTGVSAPYRGARGIFKLALVPLPDQPLPHPLVDLLGGILTEGAQVVVVLVLHTLGAVVASPILLVMAFALSPGLG